MKPFLYIHAGLPKTGTTTIQEFFYNNRTRLIDYGILYPATGVFGGGHVKIATPYTAPKTKRKMRKTNLWIDDWDPLFGRDSVLSELEMTPTKIHSVLISAESLVETDDAGIDLIVKHYQPYFNIKIIIYLRRQDYLAESIHSQAYLVRQVDFLRDDAFDIKNNLFNFKLGVLKWSERLGKHNVILREYPEGQKNNILLEGFVKIISTRDIPGLKSQENMNNRLNRNLLEYIQHFTNLRYGTKVYFDVIELLRQLSENTTVPVEYSNFYSPEEREEILDIFNENNKHVSDEYFSGKLFSKCLPINPAERWKRYPGLNNRQVVSIERYLAQSGFTAELLC